MLFFGSKTSVSATLHFKVLGIIRSPLFLAARVADECYLHRDFSRLDSRIYFLYVNKASVYEIIQIYSVYPKIIDNVFLFVFLH